MCRIFDADPRELRLHQFLDRQAAPAVAQADDDAAHAVRLDEARDIGGAAEHGGPRGAVDRVGRLVVHEANQPVAEIALDQNLARHCAGGAAGADDQDPLFEVARVGNAVEHDAPGEHRDEEQAEGRDDDAAAQVEGRHGDVQAREDDGRGAGRLQEPDDEFATRLHQRQVVEVVVVQGELAHHCREACLPQHGGRVGRGVVQAHGSGDRAEDQQDLARECRHAARRDRPLEQCHPSASLTPTPGARRAAARVRPPAGCRTGPPPQFRGRR